MGFFDINYNTLLAQLLPVRLRTSRMKAWLNCLLEPVNTLYILFVTNRNNNMYVLAHNSQVAYLQAVLNDTFDLTGRSILIIDGAYKDPIFAYLAPETKPIWLGLRSEAGTTAYPDPQTLYTSAETSLLGIAFIVKVPHTLIFDTDRMRAIIDLYRLAGKNSYKIDVY